jgi:hypothetical protein
MNIIMSSVLLVCLFQENKSYGSKKPFAHPLVYKKVVSGTLLNPYSFECFHVMESFHVQVSGFIFWESFFLVKIFSLFRLSPFLYFSVCLFSKPMHCLSLKKPFIFWSTCLYTVQSCHIEELFPVSKYFPISRMSLFLCHGWSTVCTFLSKSFHIMEYFPVRLLPNRAVISKSSPFKSPCAFSIGGHR